MILKKYIKNYYGSYRGFLRFIQTDLLRRIGTYNALKKIETQDINRLVFVCSGNICRSPLGEYFAKAKGVKTASFGLSTNSGSPADPRAISYAASKNIDLTLHQTQRVEDYSPRAGDLLIAMEPIHIKKLQARFGDSVAMTLAGLWLQKPIAYLHDPYNTNLEYFEHCSSAVEESAKNLAARLKLGYL